MSLMAAEIAAPRGRGEDGCAPASGDAVAAADAAGAVDTVTIAEEDSVDASNTLRMLRDAK